MNSGALISDSGEGEPQGGSRVAAESRSATGIRRLARMSSGVDAFGFQLTAAGRRRALMIAGSVAASLRALVKYASSWGPSTISDESSERRCRGGRSLRWSEALPWSAAEALRLHPTCPWQTAWNEGMRSAEGSARRGIPSFRARSRPSTTWLVIRSRRCHPHHPDMSTTPTLVCHVPRYQYITERPTEN